MGSLYRSEPMKLCQLIVPKDAAYACVANLGKHGYVQFKDLNEHVNEFQRHFAKDVKRCGEMERCLRYLEGRILDCDTRIEIKPIDDDFDLDTDDGRESAALEGKILDLEKEVRHHYDSNAAMHRSYNEFVEYLHVLQKTDEFFNEHMDTEAMSEIEAAEAEVLGEPPLFGLEEANAWFIAGIMAWEKRIAFERVLWRACRRTAFVRHAEIEEHLEDPITGLVSKKCVFIVFFKGNHLKKIVNKVCDGFNATQYPCPKTGRERQETAMDITRRMNELRLVMGSTRQQRYNLLKVTAEHLPQWQQQVSRRKAVYHALNMFTLKTEGQFFVMECWIPVRNLRNVRQALDAGVEAARTTVKPIINVLDTTEDAPTYHRTNKFTQVFQSIVDAYGVASYREVNPAPFTIITFPFLFAIMFGDFAHGLLMLLSSLFFILNERKIERKKITDEIFSLFYGGRYVVLLMGMFSMYTGLLYNDFFAKSVNIFGSSWKNPYNRTMIDNWIAESGRIAKPVFMTFDPKDAYSDEGPYVFGMDPIWNVAENRLTFLNSMKMKAAVIVGISQMVFGIILSFFNFRKFRSRVDIFFNFIPQMIFISSVFVYLCLQILVKWIFFSVNTGVVFDQFYPGSNCAPSLLIGLVNMFMFKDRPAGFMTSKNSSITVDHCALAQWYPHQSLVEAILIIAAVLCVPVMLCAKPIIMFAFHSPEENRPRKRNDTLRRLDTREEELILLTAPGHESDEPDIAPELPEDKTDVIVHQAIHTIEFALGCVSHTASYLRLWALSLAHAQLSEVLWHMVFAQSFAFSGFGGSVIAYVAFIFFAALTYSILVVMEGLSAFLHALRLHWVEFQSKFYQGLGHQFVPFSFVNCVPEQARRYPEVL